MWWFLWVYSPPANTGWAVYRKLVCKNQLLCRCWLMYQSLKESFTSAATRKSHCDLSQWSWEGRRVEELLHQGISWPEPGWECLVLISGVELRPQLGHRGLEGVEGVRVLRPRVIHLRLSTSQADVSPTQGPVSRLTLWQVLCPQERSSSIFDNCPFNVLCLFFLP